jgi:hypothetical protein
MHSFQGLTQRVWDGIANASIVVADISGLNANVMYEIGLAHGLGSRTFLIRDQSTEIPFDIRDSMVLQPKLCTVWAFRAVVPFG